MKKYRLTTKEEFFHPIMSHVFPLFAFEGGDGIIGGTCVLVANNFALTAKHVMEYIFEKFDIDISNSKKTANVSLDVYILHAGTGHIWYVSQCFSWIGTDIMLLRLHPRSESTKKYIPKRLGITVDPPKVGSVVTAIGYPFSEILIHRNDDEMTKLGLTLKPTVSVGLVSEIYHSHRDMSLLKFPSFSVDACFSAGMSGGAVFNEKKELCGLICAGLNENSEEGSFYSNAVSIWPSMIIPITLNDDGKIPHGLEANKPYRVIDLARNGFLEVNGHERVTFFKHANGSDGVRLQRLG